MRLDLNQWATAMMAMGLYCNAEMKTPRAGFVLDFLDGDGHYRGLQFEGNLFSSKNGSEILFALDLRPRKVRENQYFCFFSINCFFGIHPNC